MLDLIGESNTVALIGLLGGLALGLAARLGRFCTLGAIEDLLYGGDARRMQMWAIAIGTAIIGVHLATASGGLVVENSRLLSTHWNPIASVLGGLMFGYGMALSGNCGYGALARLGGGDLRSFVMVLVIGLSAYFVMSGPLATARVWLLPIEPAHGSPQSLPQLFQSWGVAPLLTGLACGGAVLAWALIKGGLTVASILWGAVVGLAVVSGWVGTQWVAATGFEATPVESHSFSAPIGETLYYGMTASGTALSFGVGSVLGVLVGAAIGSMIKGHFRWEACDDPRELKRQILGAALMGPGAVIAAGCSVGQGISAFSILTFSAPVTFVAIFAGAAIGLKQLITGFAPAE